MNVDTNSAEAQTSDENLDEMEDSDSTVTEDTITDRNADLTANEGPTEEPDKTATIEDRHLNPVQASHEISTTADYVYNSAMGVATEVSESLPSVDIGKKSANGLDETSDTMDLVTNPVGSAHRHEVETRPFNKLIQQVLGDFVVKYEPIKPYWSFGALEVIDAEKANITLPILLVARSYNRKLVNMATTMFYGENTFVLEHATLALWWLRRIGSNLNKLKRLEIKLEGGEMEQGFGVLHETLWYKIFLMLHAEHQTHRLQELKGLQELKVDFSKETCAQYKEEDESVQNVAVDIREPRAAIISTLLCFRGLRKATIVPGLHVSPWTAGVIERALLMNPGQTDADVMALEQVFQRPQRVKYLF